MIKQANGRQRFGLRGIHENYAGHRRGRAVARRRLRVEKDVAREAVIDRRFSRDRREVDTGLVRAS